MLNLRVSRAPRGRLTVDLRGPGGALVTRVTSKLDTAKEFSKAADELGIALDALVQAVDAFEREGTAEAHLTSAGSANGTFGISVRDLTASSDTAVMMPGDPIQALDSVLATRWDLQDPLMSWEDGGRLSAVDLDAPPARTESDLRALLAHFQPSPCMAWVTKSGGFRLMYAEFGKFSADELAAMAYLHLSTTLQYSGLEVKRDSRLPPGEVLRREQTADPRALRGWLRQYQHDDKAAKEWLDDHGLELNGRYEHNVCPVAPSTTAHGRPIVVGEYGVKCFVCEAHGICRGCSKPGFFPYATLVGGSTATLLYSCLDNSTHWEHAQFVLAEKYALRGRYAELAYRAALKLHHPNLKNGLLDRVMYGGKNFVRMDGRWTTLNGETYTKDAKQIIAQLPASYNGSGKPDPARVAVLEQTFDLAQYGYPHLTPVFGMRVSGHFLQLQDNRIRCIVHVPALAREGSEHLRPKYVDIESRMPEAQAKGIIEQACPGVSWELIKLLIAAKGIAEASIGMPPMVYISGPTGAAKSSTIGLAAAMCGDAVTDVVWVNNVERVRQSIQESKERGTFVAFNEILKESSRAKNGPVQTADFILNLTADSVSHKMYVGPVQLGTLPVFVWTDTHVPLELKQDAQLARRLIHVHLSHQVDWRETLRSSGLNQMRRIRTLSQQYADACNSIVSGVIDEFFRDPMTFEDIAAKLGYTPMAQSSEAAEGEEVLRLFFAGVCAAPELTAADAARWTGRGWKLIQRSHETPLSSLWEQVCDDGWLSSRRCEEVDWCKLLKLSEPCKFELRLHGNAKLALRFKSVEGTRSTYRVNSELVAKAAT